MDTFVQEMGRGGRDGSFANELILFKSHKIYLKNVESDLVRLCKENSECRRKLLSEGYGHKPAAIIPIHNCCDICGKRCKCENEDCSKTHPVFNVQRVDKSSEEEMKREVHECDKSLLKDKDDLLKFSLSDSKTVPVVSIDILHGLTNDVIKDIVKK